MMKVYKIGKNRASLVLVLLGAFFMTFLAACGVSTGTASNSSPFALSFSGDSGGSYSSAAADAHQSLQTAVLQHSPTGTATLAWNPSNEELKVTIVMSGLAPNSAHAAHIHIGSCQTDGKTMTMPKPLYTLKPVVADASGNAIIKTTKIEHVTQGIPASGWYINVHNGLGMDELGHRPISCGNIHNSENKQFVQVKMKGTTAPNESASGRAELVKVNGKYVLRITMVGLQPGSKHVAHIHTGSCMFQGPPVVMLNPVVANDQGNGRSDTIFDHLPSSTNGLYVNVHTGDTMPKVLSSPLFFNPIACGNLS